MTEFAENRVEILREYFPGSLYEVMLQVRAELERIRTGKVDATVITTNDGVFIQHDNGEAHKVYEARRALLAFLGHASFDAFKEGLDSIYDHCRNREFGNADAGINMLTPFPELERVNKTTFATAFEHALLNFVVVRVTPSGRQVLEGQDLPGYAGPQLFEQQLDQLLTFQNVFTGESEFTFRTTLLRAECSFGLRQFQQAIDVYASLLPPSGVLPAPPTEHVGTHGNLHHHITVIEILDVVVDPGQPEEVQPVEQKKFVAIRSAGAHLALGDSLFRQARALSGEQRAQAFAAYGGALVMLQENDVSADNPLWQQITEYAELQKLKLTAGFNFLGFKDSYVPILRPEKLRQLAMERFTAAQDAASRYEEFKAKANKIDDVKAEFDQEMVVAGKSVDIAGSRVVTANLQIMLLKDRQAVIAEALADKRDFLIADTLVAGFGALLGVGSPASVGGIASGLVSFLAARDELEYQQRAAQIEESIAGRERQIAMAEKRIAEFRREFAEAQREIVERRGLNSDRYYKLANTFEGLAENHLDVAIHWAYLYERAVAFKRLLPDLRRIEFDYRGVQGDLLGAPATFKADLLLVDEADIPTTEGDVFQDELSLRSRYPIEFSRFVQTGRMNFVISLYDLDKLRPGVFKRRLTGVNVRVVGSFTPTAFGGRIIHRGPFLLRDLDSTLDPDTTRLIPTVEELAEMFTGLETGDTPGDAIRGVIPYMLDEDRHELSANTLINNTIQDKEFALELFEGYGPAALWTLEIDHVDRRSIHDVILILTVRSPESSGQLQRRVKELSAAYEQELSGEGKLDRITVLSLLQQDRDAFFGLRNGPVSLVLTEDDFPSNLTDLKVKSVVVQLLDVDRRAASGITFTLTKEGQPFALERTTGDDGFSEEVDAGLPSLDPSERFPVFGTWRMALADPTRFDDVFFDSVQQKVGDIVLFFIYEFTET